LLRLVGDLVIAGFAAGGAVVQPIVAEANVELALTENAVLLAVAAVFGLLALAAAGLGFGSHAEHSTAMENSGKCSVGNNDLVGLLILSESLCCCLGSGCITEKPFQADP
jgi:hypothetical protein